ncbi:MAG TPA: 50S ribosomal protein L5 [Candidatus Magasanikbacteria bacterium]|nr:50S ribosomal protein L5 [Candidatus Magasanikbacteria bacterium]
MESRLNKIYKEKVVPALMAEFGFKNVMQVPKIKKVTVNVGYGRFIKDGAYIENVTKTLTVITGQKPVHNKTTKSISNFKIREGNEIGVSVTLHGKRMYDFLDKMANIVLPRVKDFRGISPKSFDKQGNYSIGFKEQLPFAEVKSDAVNKIHGLQVVITTSAKNKEQGLALLKMIGFPFRDK